MDATRWDSWTDDWVWVPSEDDQRWHAEQNEDYHDLEGPTVDEDIVKEAAWMDTYEQGLKTF